ncbi:MAG: 2-hydroxyacyl-CoA dehydratase [Candidatus Kariarchaeaceae archaeon]|jgi:benzoyl-CoA reductase subunit C
MNSEQSTFVEENNNRLFPIKDGLKFEELLVIAQEWIEDLKFTYHIKWKEETGGKIVSTFPVYVPKPLISSFDMLPVNIQGGGEFLEITHSEAYLGSFICSIPKSTLELALIGNTKSFDGFISPYICDVSRNLAGIFERNFPDKFSHMLHYPQNFKSKGSVDYLVAEYTRIIKKFEKTSNKKFDTNSLSRQNKITNLVSQKIEDIISYRNTHPGCINLDELYLILRLGTLLPDIEFLEVLKLTEKHVKDSEKSIKDFIPVIVMGPFCEQPTS